jgi:hypothetical protein
VNGAGEGDDSPLDDPGSNSALAVSRHIPTLFLSQKALDKEESSVPGVDLQPILILYLQT